MIIHREDRLAIVEEQFDNALFPIDTAMSFKIGMSNIDPLFIAEFMELVLVEKRLAGKDLVFAVIAAKIVIQKYTDNGDK